jgi:starch synthase
MSVSKVKAPTRRRSRPRILICTPEITELPEGMGNLAQFIRAKGGGLGDISAGLIQYLHQDPRFELHVVLPRYDAQIRDVASITYREIDLLGRLLGRRGIHLVTDSAFSSLDDIYGESDTHPRLRRAVAFQRYIINDLLLRLDPDIVHCNDWMTGLVPAAARALGIKSVFTLHNVFSEYETPAEIDRGGIDLRRFQEHVFFRGWPEPTAENWRTNSVDFTATGVHACDVVNTVSPTFLEEVVAGEFADIVPPSIRDTVRAKYERGTALGILNAPGDGIDPRICPHVTPYDVDDVMIGKAANKARFQREMGLAEAPDRPLFLWPSRLYAQKSPELLVEVAADFVARRGAQIALVANGDPTVVTQFRRIANTVGAGSIAHRPFREDLSLLGMAAADFVLMPSLYEPCGLPQMIGPRFGTLPVVRATGGLKDTVQPMSEDYACGNGFVFEEHSSRALLRALDEGACFYLAPTETRRGALMRVMTDSHEQHTLAHTAREYIRVYETLLDER